MSTPPEDPLVPPSPHHPADTAPPTASQEYPQPAGYPPAYPHAAPAWPQQFGASHPGWETPDARALREAEAALRKARTALGWAIGAAVVAALALLAAFVVPFFSSVAFSDSGSGYSYRGQVDSFEPGRALTGSAVADAVENALVDDGADVSEISCPDTTSAQVSTAIACQGTVDGDDWAYVVYLLDDAGSILVAEY